jgi:hypothetical protein
MEDPNTKDHVWEISSKFQIIFMWDMNFVRICNLSEILNKDCDPGMKPSYKENVAHAHQIWDAFLQHFYKYKVLLKWFYAINYFSAFSFYC